MLNETKEILRQSLQLGNRADALDENSPLLGAIPEFDSMAVVTVLTTVEDEFGVAIEDDEITASIFETLGSLSKFIDEKVND